MKIVFGWKLVSLVAVKAFDTVGSLEAAGNERPGGVEGTAVGGGAGLSAVDPGSICFENMSAVVSANNFHGAVCLAATLPSIPSEIPSFC